MLESSIYKTNFEYYLIWNFETWKMNINQYFEAEVIREGPSRNAEVVNDLTLKLPLINPFVFSRYFWKFFVFTK